MFETWDRAVFRNPLAIAGGEILSGRVDRINKKSVSISAWGTIGLKFRRYPIQGFRRFHVPFDHIIGKGE